MKRGKLTIEDLEEALNYIKSDEHRDETRKTLIMQVVAFLNNEYPGNLVTLDLEKELLNIEGKDRESIINDLKDIGLI